MKWFCSIALIIFSFISSANAQEVKEKNVPQAVVEAFKRKYPESFVYEWEWIKKEKLYEAEFMFKGNKHEAFFTKEGEWNRTEKEIAMKDLPQAVQDAFYKSEYSKWKIDDVKEIASDHKGLIYNIEVESGRKEIELYIYEFAGQWNLVNYGQKK